MSIRPVIGTHCEDCGVYIEILKGDPIRLCKACLKEKMETRK